MRTRTRLILSIVSAVFSYYFVYWIGGALLLDDLPPSLVSLISLGCGALAGWLAWAQSGSTRPGIAHATLMGAAITGGIGFCAGFFGPMIFAPGANQGPLLGLFITGPLGVVLGAIGGFVYGLARKRQEKPS